MIIKESVSAIRVGEILKQIWISNNEDIKVVGTLRLRKDRDTGKVSAERVK